MNSNINYREEQMIYQKKLRAFISEAAMKESTIVYIFSIVIELLVIAILWGILR